MEEQEFPSSASVAAPSDPRSVAWTDTRCLLVLFILVALLRLWQVTHTEVLARDSVGYISIAWRLAHEDWRTVLPSVTQHTGYPVAILPFAAAFRSWIPDDPARAMVFAAQWAGVAFSLLLIFPVYYLGKELFDRRVGFWAVVFLQALPATGRLMADGLSEPVFLCFAVGGLFCACRALRCGAVAWFAAAGLLGGLAYLTRVEGALVVGSTGLVLLAFQAVPRLRRSWPNWMACAGALSFAGLAAALPYMIVIGGITVKPIKHHLASEPAPHWSAHEEADAAPTIARSPLPWAVWLTGSTLHPEDRTLWALNALRVELVKATFYILWLPALLGLFLFRDRLWRVPGSWVVVVLCVLLLALLYRVAQVMGYLSERHAILVVLVGLYPAVAALAVVGKWLAAMLPFLHPRERVSGTLVTLSVLTLLAVAPLPRTLATLHGDRAGFRRAGEWLAHHAEPRAEVFDPYSWAGYYAGRYFGSEKPDFPSGHAVTYVVLEENSTSNHDHLWWLIPVARKMAGSPGSEQVARFPTGHGKTRAEVCIYRVPAGPAVTRAGTPDRSERIGVR
jgi:hypothetical protein